MDGTRDAVGEPDVELGQGVFLVNGGFGQITDGGGLDHVLDRVTLDGFVLAWGQRKARLECSGRQESSMRVIWVESVGEAEDAKTGGETHHNSFGSYGVASGLALATCQGSGADDEDSVADLSVGSTAAQSPGSVPPPTQHDATISDTPHAEPPHTRWLREI